MYKIYIFQIETLKPIKLPLYEMFKFPPPQYRSKANPEDSNVTKEKDNIKGFQEMLDLGLDG